MSSETTFDPVAYINTPRWQQMSLGLNRIQELLNRLGRPQDSLRFVHVAGTNGKGSVCAYIASILQAAGLRTGLFTSPYIECFHERIRVDGKNITDEELLTTTLLVKEHASIVEAQTGEHPSEFELMCAVALVHFARACCDIAVLEVGLGGRLDATNVIDAPEVSVIARLGFDHTAILGNTMRDIAHEKAGIIKQDSSVVSWPNEPDAMKEIAQAAAVHRCELAVPDFTKLQIKHVQIHDKKALREFSYSKFNDMHTQLLGLYQPYNASLAIEAICALKKREWTIPDTAIYEGVARTLLPGRFECMVQQDKPTVVIDGGHNPQGAHALAQSLQDVFPQVRPVFIVGMLADKDYREMVCEVVSLADAFVCITPPNPRALSATELAYNIRRILDERTSDERVLNGDTRIPVIATSSFAEAVAYAYQRAGEKKENGLICAFGSLYSVAGIRAALANPLNQSPPTKC